MNKFLYASLICILIAYVDGINVFTSRNFRKITVYSGLFFIAVVLNLLLFIDVKIHNPMEAVQTFIVSIFGNSLGIDL